MREANLRDQLSLLLKIGVRLSIGSLVFSYFLILWPTFFVTPAQLAKFGIAVLVLIPFVRVLYMSVYYLTHRDRALGLIALVVFSIMSLSLWIGQTHF